MAFQAAYDGVKNAAGKVNKLVNMVFGIGGCVAVGRAD